MTAGEMTGEPGPVSEVKRMRASPPSGSAHRAEPSERSGTVRLALRAALTAAMKGRDREAVQTYRVALAAIDNAEAVPLVDGHRAGALESSSVGPGSADVARRALPAARMAEIVRQEAAQRRVDAELLRPVSPERAEALEREADRLTAVLRLG